MNNLDKIRTRQSEHLNDVRVLRRVRESLDDIINYGNPDIMHLMYDVESIANGLMKEYDELDEMLKLLEEKLK